MIRLYQTLTTGVNLAKWMNDDSGLIDTWLNSSSALRQAINSYCWDATFGAYKDNSGSSTLYPQDANSLAVAFNVTSPASNASESIGKYLQTNWNEYGAVSPELPENIVPFISSFELQAHFISGQTLRALELIRRSWGWYLNNPNGTESTLIEGFKDDGTFAYRYNNGYKDPSYTSHAHGWSSGPTSALTEYVLGLHITDRSGKSWRMSPQFGDLTHVEGGFTTTLGKFSASWEVTDQEYEVRVNTPAGTSGKILLPIVSNTTNIVRLNNRLVHPTTEDGAFNLELAGGSYVIRVS